MTRQGDDHGATAAATLVGLGGAGLVLAGVLLATGFGGALLDPRALTVTSALVAAAGGVLRSSRRGR